MQAEALGLVDHTPFGVEEHLPHALKITFSGPFLATLGNAKAINLFQVFFLYLSDPWHGLPHK
jgi:hypothetical protein